MNKHANIPNTYTDAQTLLGDADERTVDRNTILLPMPDGSIGLKFHRTVILRYNADGTMTVDAGGFRTSTTKERLNQAMPEGFRIYSKGGTWKVDAPNGETYDFQDGWKIIPEAARSFYAFREAL